MFKPSHLTDEAANVLAGAIDERVYFIQSKRWIAYPKAVHILDHLNKLLKHPRTTRMPSLIVYGDSGMGKSMFRWTSSKRTARRAARPTRRQTPIRCSSSN